uniref:THD domain-containing protein n=1 Tax=Monopterus albus TaxID=43700 RepID=A0A3Q3JNI6_MONAL
MQQLEHIPPLQLHMLLSRQIRVKFVLNRQTLKDTNLNLFSGTGEAVFEPQTNFGLSFAQNKTIPLTVVCLFDIKSVKLRSVATGNTSDGQLIKWDVMFGDNYYYNEEKRAILIHENGLYFVYIRITLSCRSEDGPEGFSVKLQRWNKGYDMIVPLTDAKDGVDCTSQRSRNVFVGQLFDLSEGDHLSVWIDQGYKLIATASAGAFCI